MATRTRTALVIALAGIAIGVPALAQTGATSTYQTACDKQPSAGDQEAAHASFTLGTCTTSCFCTTSKCPKTTWPKQCTCSGS